MATSTRRPAHAPRISNLLDELRGIRERHGPGAGPQALATFAKRHRLTHRDVDALLAALAQKDTATPEFGAAEATDAATSGVADQKTDSDPDLAWLFEEEPEPQPPRAVDDLVGRALDDLLDECSRRGELTRSDVALLASRQGLTPAQHGELLDQLGEAGVELPDLAGPRPRRGAPKGYELREDAVGQYLRVIGRYPLIDGPREIELWSLISHGAAAQSELDKPGGHMLSPEIRRSLQVQIEAGRQAHAELVCANLRLVVSIAKARHYDSSGVEFADRIQDGNLGLMHAAGKFDGSKGFKFSTYATWWIRQSIERGIGDRGRTIRVPIYLHERRQKIRKAVTKLTARLDREPSLTEIADATGMEAGQVQAVLDLTRPVVSLDRLMGDDGDLRLSDLLFTVEDRDGRADPAEIVGHAMMRRDLTRTLAAVLPSRAVQILERRFGIGTGDEETLDDIGIAYGVTRERIRQIQSKSLNKLRQSGRVAELRAYIVDDSKASLAGGHLEGTRQ